MDQVIHALTTLWVYARRERYLQEVAAEDAALAQAETETTDIAERSLLHRRRTLLQAEMQSLASPLRWSSFALSAQVATIASPAGAQAALAEAYVEAA